LNSGRGNITTNSSEATPGRIVFRGRSQAAAEDAPITEAEVIVSAGRGIRKKENLELIERLAGLFSRSAVGGSRSVCDLGWLEYSRQVGITGKTVAPKLYIACGISGASQHIAGMKDSQLIIAINSDPGAAIFSIADYGIVEDLTTFIPLVIEESGKPA
jgi:electron transfer flavoprotein alpha subunit